MNIVFWLLQKGIMILFSFPPPSMCGSCCECGACKVIRIIVSLLLLAATVAAFIGMWHNHVTPTGWVFGTTEGSLSILTFVASLMLLFKTSKKLCPCNSCNCSTKDKPMMK